MKIIAFIKALLPRLNKEQILEDLRITQAELEQIVNPNYFQAQTFFKSSKFASKTNKELSEGFYRNFDLQGTSKQGSFIGEIARRTPFLQENLTYIAEMIENILERDVINEGLSAKKAILIRAAEHMSFITRYSVDLLNYVYINETMATGADANDNDLSPGQITHINKNLATFASLLSDYGIPNKDFSKLIGKIPEVNVNSKTANTLIGVYKEKDIDPFTSGYVAGFTGNPIYHIRLQIAEWQSNRYKANKDKKKVLELRLLHLKLVLEKKHDPKIENEINYIQSRVDKIEHYLRDVESTLDQE